MEAYETPRTLATKLGITQVALRRWLRALPKDQHEFAKHHDHGGFWRFSPSRPTQC